ncbi:protein OSCP1-like [Trichogramma pretiosum]|uniref:protein OSCP1-like n=1 Tax=Trichogramma pretiosum TaxID=7493 RepID=UPI0006C947BF|nr:protein OSCP1-like [Trichogramma pretiosum]
MSNYATPILYLNMGGEMMYVLQQRLQTQRVSLDKTIQVMNDVLHALLNPKQLESIFSEGPLLRLTSLRSILERVILCSIMRLDPASMDKLFDLMIMMVKYQLATSSGPREIILSTLNHLDALRDMTAMDRKLTDYVDQAHQRVVDIYGNMTHRDVWQIRTECLTELKPHNVRVSALLRLGMQNQDASFNRICQRYDEKYRDRKQLLDNLKLNDYVDEDGQLGSFAINAGRSTLIGKNIYVMSYGLANANSVDSSQSFPRVLSVSNKAARQELDSLTKQLGQEEELAPIRPFSLSLYTRHNANVASNNNNNNNNNNNGSKNVESDKDEEGNEIVEKSNINEYKKKLMQDIDKDFGDDEEITAINKNRDDNDIISMLEMM